VANVNTDSAARVAEVDFIGRLLSNLRQSFSTQDDAHYSLGNSFGRILSPTQKKYSQPELKATQSPEIGSTDCDPFHARHLMNKS
jgi:hypothetical protein